MDAGVGMGVGAGACARVGAGVQFHQTPQINMTKALPKAARVLQS